MVCTYMYVYTICIYYYTNIQFINKISYIGERADEKIIREPCVSVYVSLAITNIKKSSCIYFLPYREDAHLNDGNNSKYNQLPYFEFYK